jgi:hypothetical protein
MDLLRWSKESVINMALQGKTNEEKIWNFLYSKL